MDYLKLDSVPMADGPPGDVETLEQELGLMRQAHPGAIIRRYRARIPSLDPTSYVAEGAVLVGDVRLHASASVWFGCVLRADLAPITVGARTNVQDGTVVHLGDVTPTVIGCDVTIGHRAVLHGCTIGDACLIGMQATVLDGAVIGEGSVVGAGSVVTAGTVVPPHSLVLGTPGRVVRDLTAARGDLHRKIAEKYMRLVHNHRLG